MYDRLKDPIQELGFQVNLIPGINKIVIAIPETKANLTCVYNKYSASPICKGKLKYWHEN